LSERSNSSDYYAHQLNESIDPLFLRMKDSILIVSSEEKEISSTEGHQLMMDHPYRKERFNRAHQNYETLLKAMEMGDLTRWGEIVESEALELHGLMMSSLPGFILMKPNTLTIIEKIRELRKKEKIHVYFSLDAGPNIHLLYPECYYNRMKSFIDLELTPLLDNGKWIDDCVGNGPISLKDL